MFVSSLNVHKFRYKILRGYTGDLKMIGGSIIKEHKQSTAVRFKNVETYETNFLLNNIDNDYDAGDSILIG